MAYIPKDMKTSSYIDFPCPRCGSKQRISKRWKEKVATFSGSITVDCSQIVCTNKTCQAAFDKNLIEETKKREAQKIKKEEQDEARKISSLHNAQLARKRA